MCSERKNYGGLFDSRDLELQNRKKIKGEKELKGLERLFHSLS